VTSGDRSAATATGRGVSGDAPFDRYGAADVADLIREYPLAWVVARAGGAVGASLLPLLVETGADGAVVTLVGHMARRNPLFAALTADPGALILFTGPNGYVSPNTVGDRNWGPTWNYAQVRVEAEVTFVPEENDAALAALTAAMERGQPAPWQVAEIGDRYDGMAAAIIAFRARVTRLEARFKLGQDERPAVLAAILAGQGDADLVRWMRRMNAERLG